jgi:putative inorganic carbon (HCO3(-)) transporter
MLVGLMTLAQVLFRTHTRQVLWVLPALLILMASLTMTHTRSAWLGFLVGCGVLLGLYKKKLLLALPLLGLAVFLLVPSAVKMRALSMLDRRDATAQQRLSMWSSGWRIVRDHPWTGIGMGAIAQVFQRYRDPESPIKPTRRLGHLHNNIVQVAVERGLLGLAAWLWLWVAYLWQAWLIYRRLGPEHPGGKALVAGSLASVIGFHVAGLFEHTFGDSEVVTLVFFLSALPFVVQHAHRHHQAATLAP